MIDFIRCHSKSSSSKGLKLIYKYQAVWMYIKNLLDIPIAKHFMSTWYHITAGLTHQIALFLVDIEGLLSVMAVKWSAVLAQWLREADFSSDLKAGGAVQQLNYMTDAGLRRLREARFQFLHHKQHQNLPGESRAVLQRQQHQLQSVFLHGCDSYGQRHTISAGVEQCVLGHVRRTESCSGCSQTRKLKVRSDGKISVSQSESALWVIIIDSQAQTHIWIFPLHELQEYILDYLQFVTHNIIS